MDELRRTVGETELDGVPVLVLANKQDLPNALTHEEISRAVMTIKELRHRNWCVFSACATSGDGLYDALDWLTNMMANSKAKQYLEKTITSDEEKTFKDENGNTIKADTSKRSYFKDMLLSFHKLFV